MAMSNVVCFGEVLWDIFPSHKKIGGAPLNVALQLASFNHNVTIISAIGKDENGEKLLKYLNENGLNTDNLQKHEIYDTGSVNVILNDKGSATYEIMYPRAWDKIVLTNSNIEAVKKSDAFVFGSLVTRDAISKETLYALVELANYKVFDLNLRPPHYSKDILIHLMEASDFIKFNDEELYEVCTYLGSKYNSLEQNLKFIAEKTNSKHICVTKGPFGAVLLYDSKLYYNSGYKIKVADTVGAGDAFLGTLISNLLNEIDPQQAIDVACAVGALVARSEGANPKLTLLDIAAFINPK